MELETKLPVPDREARRVIEDNFRKIKEMLVKLQTQVDDLSKSDINTEYITDTNISTDTTTDVPISIDVNDTNNSDDHFQGITIK